MHNIRVEHINLLAPRRNTAEAIATLRNAGDTVLVHRGVDRAFVMRCPCGCNDTLIINLDERAGQAWRHYTRKKTLTIFPSYWRDDGCGSHFIVSRGRILWCNMDSDYWDGTIDPALLRAVRVVLPVDRLCSLVELADKIDALPWDVLMACRQLVRQELAIEGLGHERAHFMARVSDKGQNLY